MAIEGQESMSRHLEAWAVAEQDFPRHGSAAEKLEFCLRYAILGHSTYNNQPWHFVISNNTVSVYVDRRYALPVLDPDDRQLITSCGTAIFNLRLAIRYFGHQEYTQLLPNPADENLLARVQIADADYTPSEDDRLLFPAIRTRHINRSAFKKKEVEREKLDALKAAAKKESAWLHICEGDERDVVSYFIAEGDHEQMSRKAFRRELAMWIDERRFVSGDGFPDYARPVKDIMHTPRPRVIRRFEVEPGNVVQNDQIAEGCPVLAIIGSEKGGTVNRLYAGQAFMRVLLQAEAFGLAVSTLNQPCEVPDLRLRLQDEIEHMQGRSQYILRIGYADRVVNYSPRRQLETFVTHAGHEPVYARVANDQSGKTSLPFWGRFKKLWGAK
jgi:hypothetical protein